jgi:nitroreductase
MPTKLNPDRVYTQILNPASVDQAICSRFSVRAFLDKSVEDAVIEEILKVASQAPSGVNTQPWKVYVLKERRLQQLVTRVSTEHDLSFYDPQAAKKLSPDYNYYPSQWPPLYLKRRRENGWGLYQLLKIEKRDKERMHQQHNKNYHFFGAPVGLFFTVNRDLAEGSLLDYGMFLQSIMVAARARGLHTCPQAAWNMFAPLVRLEIEADDDESLVCGMALGYADAADVVNSFDAGRVEVKQFTKWLTS